MTDDELVLDADGEPRTDIYYDAGRPRTDLKDGVYLDMPDAVYFAQKRLGSSDGKHLASDHPEDLFWGSEMNPDREVVESEEDLLFGQGWHCRTLRGDTAFDAEFIKSPHDSYVSKAAKEWKAEVLRKGIKPLKAKTYRNVLLMSDVMLNNPETRAYLSGGIAEVSVLFTCQGVRMRARYDKLLSRQICDLKSMGRHKDSTVSPDYLQARGLTRDAHTCFKIIRDLRYTLQIYWYNLARHHMRDMIRNHSEQTPFIYGASAARLKWLQEQIAPIDAWQFVFLFARKVSHSSKNPAAPVVQPIVVEHDSFLVERGCQQFNVAMDNYTRLMEQFGETVGWSRFNPAIIADDVAMTELFGGVGDQPATAPAEDDTTWDDEEAA